MGILRSSHAKPVPASPVGKLSGLIARLTNAVRAGKRSFDAAGGSGRWPSSAQTWAQNSQSLAARGIIAKRSNYLAHNSPTGAAFKEAWVTNLIGDGPTIKSAHPNPDVRADLEDRFAEWCENADIEGVDSLTGLLMTAVRSIVQSGEAVFHLPVDPYGQLKLRLLAAEQLDSSRAEHGHDRRRAEYRQRRRE